MGLAGQLEALPEPIQRYFEYALKDGQSYISYIHLTHDGQFKTALNKNWIVIEGDQYFTTEKPSFIWNETLHLFTARDMYIANEGRLTVSLLFLYNLVNGKGKSFNQ